MAGQFGTAKQITKKRNSNILNSYTALKKKKKISKS